MSFMGLDLTLKGRLCLSANSLLMIQPWAPLSTRAYARVYSDPSQIRMRSKISGAYSGSGGSNGVGVDMGVGVDLGGTASVFEVILLSMMRSWIRASYVAAAFIISARVSLRGPLTNLSLTLSRRP